MKSQVGDIVIKANDATYKGLSPADSLQLQKPTHKSAAIPLTFRRKADVGLIPLGEHYHSIATSACLDFDVWFQINV